MAQCYVAAPILMIMHIREPAYYTIAIVIILFKTGTDLLSILTQTTPIIHYKTDMSRLSSCVRRDATQFDIL